MGFRFSRRIKILPGLSLNLSCSGVSLSAGVRGAHLNFSPRGTYASAGIPGTGLSYRQRVGGGRRATPIQEGDAVKVGNRENDALAGKLFAEGPQNVSLSLEELKRYRQDPRFTLSDPVSGRRWSQPWR